MSMSMSVRACLRLPLSVYACMCMPMCMCMCLSICLSVCLPVCRETLVHLTPVPIIVFSCSFADRYLRGVSGDGSDNNG